jgi:hypothetical protein
MFAALQSVCWVVPGEKPVGLAINLNLILCRKTAQ